MLALLRELELQLLPQLDQREHLDHERVEVAPMEYLLLVVKLGQELEHLLLVELQQQPTSQQLVQVK